MNLLDLLDALDDRGLAVRYDHGRLIVSPTSLVDDNLRAAIRDHRDMLAAVVLGRHSGHAPAPCTICGQVSLTAIATSDGKPRKAWHPCRMTPGCTADPDAGKHGRHIPRTVDIDRTALRPVPARKAPPVRPPTKRLLGPWPAWPAPTDARAS